MWRKIESFYHDFASKKEDKDENWMIIEWWIDFHFYYILMNFVLAIAVNINKT